MLSDGNAVAGQHVTYEKSAAPGGGHDGDGESKMSTIHDLKEFEKNAAPSGGHDGRVKSVVKVV